MTTTLVQIDKDKVVCFERILSIEPAIGWASSKIRLIEGVEVFSTWDVLTVAGVLAQAAFLATTADAG